MNAAANKDLMTYICDELSKECILFDFVLRQRDDGQKFEANFQRRFYVQKNGQP
jgi:hypothetical protein